MMPDLKNLNDDELLPLARAAVAEHRRRREVLAGLELDLGSGDDEVGGLAVDVDAVIEDARRELRRAVREEAARDGRPPS